MDTAINDYKARKEKRLAERGIYPEGISKIIAFAQRRAARLDARGYRADAPDEEQENNQEGGGDSGGSHGNTRLPFGLCKRFGIEIDPSWGPREAWDALAGKGITPAGAYEKLKKGEDPGAPDGAATPEPPKEPVKKVALKEYGGAEYESLSARRVGWDREEPWRLRGEKVDGSGEGAGYVPDRMSLAFHTKMDMLMWLKEKGVEEFPDPETGEIINPKEMETPEVVLSRGGTRYSAVTIGLRDGRYTIYGTDMDGKKKSIRDYGSLKDAKEYLEAYGVKSDDIKLSPALKKREKERTEWLSSDKKLYFEDGGVKYGDAKLEKDYWGGCYLTGEAEDGSKFSRKFATKADAMAFLKDQGVERVKLDKETLNPQEFEMPATKAVIGGRAYQDLELTIGSYGEVQLSGTDLDGEKRGIAQRRYGETLGAFKERISRDYGVGEDKLTISDETKQKMAEIEKAEEEKERIRKEFEAKAIEWPTGRKYADVELMKDGDGVYSFYGYTKDGDKRRIAYGEDMYSAEKYAEKTGHDISEFIKDDEVRKAYDRYKESMKDFEAKATDFAGDKYADIQILYEGGMYKVRGLDARGRTKEFARESSYEDLEKVLNQYGYSPTMFPMDGEATRRKEKAMKAKYALATGGYYALGKKDDAFKDISVVEGSGKWEIKGTNIDGVRVTIEGADSWDDALKKMSDHGVSDYKIVDKSGKEMGKPTYGMHSVMLMRKPEGGFVVYADSDRFGKHEIMYETPNESEARKWLRDNNVPEGGIKTRGLNPNDDVVRKHTAKSLDNFDTHRASAIEGSLIDDLTDQEKKDTVDMLTEVFDKGAIRVARSPKSFGGIIDNGYKSQIETGTGGTGAAIDKEGRKEVSDKMYGHGGLADNEYEKCGYLGFKDEAEDYNDSAHPFYGSMTYTLKKDRMEDKMTYTYGDSLNRSYRLRSAGYGGKYPTIEGMTTLYDADEVREAINAYKRYKKGEISYAEMFKKIRRNASNQYIELQFHGPVTVEDIEKVSFQSENDLKKAFDRMNSTQRKRVIKKLKDNNVGLIYSTAKGRPFKDAWDWVREHYANDMPA